MFGPLILPAMKTSVAQRKPTKRSPAKHPSRYFSYLLVIATLLGIALPFASAQDAPLKLAYIYPSRLFAAHPAGQQAADLMSQRDEELGPLVEELQALQTKAETPEGLNTDERARANLLLRSVQQTQQTYADDIRAAAAPAEEAINQAVASVAQAGGYTLVLDGELAGAGGSSLIVYADQAAVPDITEQVIAQLQGQ